MTEEKLTGASLFGRSSEIMNDDPLAEIFALNLGDFISENLISKELAEKVGTKIKDKNEGIKEQLKELVSLYSLNKTLKVLGFNSKQDYVIYKSIAKTIKDILECDAVHIYLAKDFAKGLNNKDNDLVLAGTSIDLKDENGVFGYKLSENNAASNAFKNVEAVEVKIPEDDKLFKANKNLDEERVKSATIIPMHNNVKVVGIIVAENYADKNLKEVYKKLVKSIGGLFGTSMWLQEVIEDAQLLIADKNSQTTELQHLRTELTSLIGDLGDQQQDFVEHLASAVDIKGQYKVAHSRNTAELSRKLCKQMGLNEKTTDLIYYAGLLQNIGKITLPEEMFTRSGKLTPKDWKRLQQHPNVGVNLLMNINFLSEVIPYIHYHKECWDGSGEPEGLKGMSIPLGSRIIAVADAYTALTSDRSYRNALSKEQAIEVLQKEALIRWDADVIEALIKVV